MDRRSEDMHRISKLIGSRYEKSAERSVFCVLTDEKGSTSMAGGSWQRILSGTMESLAYCMVKTAKPGIDYDKFVDAAVSVIAKELRKDLEQKIREKFGEPDISADMPDPEERLRKALLGEE